MKVKYDRAMIIVTLFFTVSMLVTMYWGVGRYVERFENYDCETIIDSSKIEECRAFADFNAMLGRDYIQPSALIAIPFLSAFIVIGMPRLQTWIDSKESERR